MSAVQSDNPGGTDAMLWLSGPMRGHWGYTLLIGADRQGRQDVDGDGGGGHPECVARIDSSAAVLE
jgi:hypothetical protein